MLVSLTTEYSRYCIRTVAVLLCVEVFLLNRRVFLFAQYFEMRWICVMIFLREWVKYIMHSECDDSVITCHSWPISDENLKGAHVRETMVIVGLYFLFKAMLNFDKYPISLSSIIEQFYPSIISYQFSPSPTAFLIKRINDELKWDQPSLWPWRTNQRKQSSQPCN